MASQAQEASVLFVLEAHKEIDTQQHVSLVSGDSMFYKDRSSVMVNQVRASECCINIQCRVDSAEKAHLVLRALHQALKSFNEDEVSSS